MKSGIMLEVSVESELPIKGDYSLTYRIDYGRNQSKWVEQVNKKDHQSRNLTLEYTFGSQKQEVKSVVNKCNE